MNNLVMTKTAAPDWLLSFWKEIDEKTFGEGFNCFVEDATCRLGVAEWNGREQIRENLRAFIDSGFAALHDVTEYWDGGSLKVFRGVVTMMPADEHKPVVKPVMTHFFYMDETDPTKVRSWLVQSGRWRSNVIADRDTCQHRNTSESKNWVIRFAIGDSNGARVNLMCRLIREFRKGTLAL